MIANFKPSLLSLPALALLGLFAGSGSAQAQSSGHIDRPAFRLQRQAQEMHREVQAHFRHTPAFRHLDRDVAALERLAGHVHEVAHRRGSGWHLRSDVDRLDRLYHHIEEQVDSLARYRGADYRTVAHLRRALAEMGRTLHHLRDDLDHSFRRHSATAG